MDGVHDLGGLAGFGRVQAPPAEPVFAADWERRAFRVQLAVLLTLQAGGGAFRHSIERMEPSHYLGSSYYEHWLTAAATLAVEAGLVSREELESRAGGAFPLAHPDRAAPPLAPESREQPRFAVGERVRVRAWHPAGHTRAPRYLQGRRGVITRIDGADHLPDVEAHGGGKVLNPTYSVRFTGAELWGEGGDPRDSICADLWEYYLEVDG